MSGSLNDPCLNSSSDNYEKIGSVSHFGYIRCDRLTLMENWSRSMVPSRIDFEDEFYRKGWRCCPKLPLSNGISAA